MRNRSSAGCQIWMRFEKLGSFGLTDRMSAQRRRGDEDNLPARGETWILNGQRKMDRQCHLRRDQCVWARDEASGQVKGFVVGKDNPGFSVKKIENKMALRVVQNVLITLKDCQVPRGGPAAERQHFQRHREGP